MTLFRCGGGLDISNLAQKNGGGTKTASASVNAKVLVVGGSSDGYDAIGGTLSVQINDSWITCSGSNGTFCSRTASAGTNKLSNLIIWVNNKQYADNIIQAVKHVGTRADGSSNVGCIYFVD